MQPHQQWVREPLGQRSHHKSKAIDPLRGTRSRQGLNYPILLGFCHLMVEWQNDGMVLHAFALIQRKRGAVWDIGIGGLTADAHDTASRGNPLVQRALHNVLLGAVPRQPHTITLPVAAGPGRLRVDADACNYYSSRPCDDLANRAAYCATIHISWYCPIRCSLCTFKYFERCSFENAGACDN